MRKLIIDAGHGWFTKGKRSIFHLITFGLFKGKAELRENNVNEAIANKLSYAYENSVFITNEWQDISLKRRVKREKKHATNNSIFLSIHADAFTSTLAEGGRIYYYSNKGKELALYLTEYLIEHGYDIRLRPPKKANFYVLKHSKSTAILFELGFMTNRNDLNFLENENYRNKTAKLLKEGIEKY